MTKRTIAAILILLLILPAVVSAGSVLFAPKSAFDGFDADREISLSEAMSIDGTSTSIPLAPLGEKNRYIVKFKSETPLSVIESALKNTDYRPLAESEHRLFAIAPDGDAFLSEHADIIDYSEPDLVRSALAITNDAVIMPSYESHGIYTAWDTVKGKSSVTVAVLDTGVDRSHEDLQNVNILSGYDAVSRSSGVNEDTAGHGTGVIGIIAAAADNGIGIAGVAHGVTILPVKVSSSSTAIYSSDLISGIRFAADAGAKIINMSVGGYSSSFAEQEAVNYAVSKGCILISAAGNGGNRPYADQKSYPASYDGVISVASCTINGERSDFSQYNDAVDVAAIGEDITMPYVQNGNSIYRTDSGTSYSCAVVSGIAALAASYIDDGVRFGADEFLALIADTCGKDRTVEFGHGIINAADIIKITNRPIITGVSDGGSYSESIQVGFNRGSAVLNGEPIEDGDRIISNGKHTLTVTDGENECTVSFRLDYDPLSYEFKEFASFAYFSFDRGNARLDGFPYKSGTRISASGRHEFILADGEEVLKKEIYLQYSLPAVYGIEDGKTYTEPVEIRIIGDGSAELDGKEIYGEAVVMQNGKHTLTVKSGNGAISKEYSFEINFANGRYIQNDYAMAHAAIDEEYRYICLYGESPLGVRIYNIDSPERFSHTLDVGKVYSHAFLEDELLLFGENGVSVIKRENVIDANVAIDRLVSPEGMDYYTFADGNVYCFDNSNMYTLDITSGETELLTELGFDCDYASYSDGNIYLLARSEDSVLRSYRIEDGTLTELFDLGTRINAATRLCFGNGYLAVNNKLIDLSDGATVLEFCSDMAVKIENNMLFTDNRVIDITSGKELGSFPISVSNMVIGNEAVYLFGNETSVAIIKNGADGVAAYGAAEISDKAFSSPEAINDYRTAMFYDINLSVISTASYGENVYVLFDGKNSLYGFSAVDFSESAPIPLRYSPKAVYASDGYIAVAFADIPAVYLATADDIQNGRYLALPDVCNSAFILNGRLYAASGGRLVYLSVNSGDLAETGIPAEAAVTNGERIYTISGTQLAVYDMNLARISQTAVQGGKLTAGNAVAVGDRVYSRDLDTETARTDTDVLAFRGNVIVTKSGVFDILQTEYIGNAGVSSAENAVICGDNSVVAFGAGLISVCSFGDGHEVIAQPNILGVTEGSIYLDRVTIEYEHGIGFLDGTPFTSGDSASGAGEHIFEVALPCGRSVSVRFTIEANIEKIEFLVGDRVMSVGETVTLRVRYLPDGASSVPVTFTCDSDGISIGEMGEITALAVGEYKVTAIVETDYGSFSAECTVTVRDDLIVFGEDSPLRIDRDNSFVLGITPGTSVYQLKNQLYSGGDAYVLNPKGEWVSDYVSTGDVLFLQRDGEISDSLICVVSGDTDGDGCISAYDLYTLERILRGQNFGKAYLSAADVNQNGIIADNDYRVLKNRILYTEQANLGTPNINLFGLSAVQTVSYIESGDIIDVVVCISGCKYARGVSGLINFSEGLEFIEASSTGLQTDYQEFANAVSFYAYGADGKEYGKAFKMLINMRFRVTADAGSNIRFWSDGLTAAFTDDCRTIRFETSELSVNKPLEGDFRIDFANAYSFDFSPDVLKYEATIPYNSALADISVTRNADQTATVSNCVIPDSGNATVTVTLTEKDGTSKIYTIQVKRDQEPRFDTNCRLESLAAEGFKLDPQFDPNVFSYNIFVPFGTEKIDISCTAQNPTAKIVIGDTALYGEETAITVTVGSLDGETLTYTLNVFMLPQEEPTDESLPDEEPENPISALTVIAIVCAVIAIGAGTAVYLYKKKNNE